MTSLKDSRWLGGLGLCAFLLNSTGGQPELIIDMLDAAYGTSIQPQWLAENGQAFELVGTQLQPPRWLYLRKRPAADILLHGVTFSIRTDFRSAAR